MKIIDETYDESQRAFLRESVREIERERELYSLSLRKNMTK